MSSFWHLFPIKITNWIGNSALTVKFIEDFPELELNTSLLWTLWQHFWGLKKINQKSTEKVKNWNSALTTQNTLFNNAGWTLLRFLKTRAEKQQRRFSARTIVRWPNLLSSAPAKAEQLPESAGPQSSLTFSFRILLSTASFFVLESLNAFLTFLYAGISAGPCQKMRIILFLTSFIIWE